MIEDMFRDLFASEKDWRIILLRYFNPVGAHPSGERRMSPCAPSPGRHGAAVPSTNSAEAR